MAFIDELTIRARAGHGGDGVVRWLHEKSKEFMGPAGGDGGNGGSVYVRAVRDVSVLSKYRHIKEFTAENGDPGGSRSMHGKNGEDLYIDLPVGSIVTNLETKKQYFLNNEEQVELLLDGGRGGFGNEHFKGSKNIRPQESTGGKVGGESDFYIEVELIASAGFIGLPNAGKSSLLNELTKAKVKVGSYQFTTLEPNLGELYGYILADIPGLIEGASDGKGLGYKFLRHIRRTKVLLHCVSLEFENPDEIYTTVRNELGKFDNVLLEKKEVIIFTKSDTVDKKVAEEKMKKVLATAKKTDGNVREYFTVSILDESQIKDLRDGMIKILDSVKAE